MNTRILSDKELVSQYLQGNDLALERLILRHKEKVYTAIYVMVRDSYLAEDLFQETFIKAIDTLRNGRYNEEGKFHQWVLRIAHNLCIDYFRKVKRTPGIVTSEGDDIFKFFGNEDTDMEMHHAREFREKRLKDLIEELQEEQKEVVIMRHYFGFSFKEIAEMTGVSINTSLGRMRYALINLRKMIEAQKVALQ